MNKPSLFLSLISANSDFNPPCRSKVMSNSVPANFHVKCVSKICCCQVESAAATWQEKQTGMLAFLYGCRLQVMSQ